jgi:hypothetical protein
MMDMEIVCMIMEQILLYIKLSMISTEPVDNSVDNFHATLLTARPC